jgi:hypothetical protein
VREVNDEVKELSNKKNVTADPLEDKLALFRQQVQKLLFSSANLQSISNLLII